MSLAVLSEIGKLVQAARMVPWSESCGSQGRRCMVPVGADFQFVQFLPAISSGYWARAISLWPRCLGY